MTDFEFIVAELEFPIFVIEKDTNHVIYTNEAVKAKLGYTLEEFQQNTDLLSELIHPDDRSEFGSVFTEPGGDKEFRIKNKNQETLWIKHNFLKSYSPSHICHILVDISEQKEKLDYAQQNLKELLNNSPSVIYRCSPANNFAVSFISSNIKEQMGYEADNFLKDSKFWADRIHPEDKDRIFTGLQKSLKPGRYSHEYRFKHADGTYRWMQDDLLLNIDEDGNPKDIIGNWVDISDKKQLENDKKHLEQDILHAQKMQAVGTLAGGIAHEFNNMLGVIMGYADLLQVRFAKNTKDYDYLDHILKASSRSKKLVKELLSFSRKNNKSLQLVDFASQLNEEIEHISSSLEGAVEIKLNVNKDTLQIMIDSNELHEILTNLINNASESMHNNGIVEIDVSKVVKSKSDHSQLAINDGSYARVTIKDYGHGVSETDLHRVFEPFFTTKDVGEGTGMGLAVVYSLVNSYGGTVTIDSEKGVGTSVNLYFPIIPVDSHFVVPSPNAVQLKKTPTILLVDDEQLIVDMETEILKSLNYCVVSSTSSEKALEIFKENPENFDLLITDQVMPGLLGTELSKILIAIKPDLPVILVTGYSPNISAKIIEGSGIQRVMTKPFSLVDVKECLAEIFT